MPFYFVWVSAQEAFEAQRLARQDETILHFEIDHQEGAIPLLRLTVPHKGHTPQKTGQRGILWQKEREAAHLLFDGVLVSNPAEKKEDFLLLVLEAGRAGKEAQLSEVLRRPQEKFFDPLLVPESDHHAVDEVLEACSLVPHWDRITGEVTLMDLAKDRDVMQIGPHFFADSLAVRTRGRPLSAVRFSITAEWVQRYDGVADLSPMIQQKGTRGYLSTLTPDDLQKKWWKKDYPLQRTGYEILESRLMQVIPPSTGGLGVYPLKSASFTVEGRPHAVAQAWFQPCLKVQWHYRQKRRETVHLTVPCGPKGEVLDLAVRLQDICSPVPLNSWKPGYRYPKNKAVIFEGKVYHALKTHESAETFDQTAWAYQSAWPTALDNPSRWSFFETPRGQKVITHVMRRAVAYGRMAARRLHVQGRLPFAQGRGLRGNENVRLEDPRLPGGAMVGQVIQYTLVAEGDTGEQWADLTLGIMTHLVDERVLKSLIPLQAPQGILSPETLGPQDLVAEIQVRNGAASQNSVVEEKHFTSLGAVHRALEKVPTRVQIELKDLKPTDVLCHAWEAEVAPL